MEEETVMQVEQEILHLRVLCRDMQEDPQLLLVELLVVVVALQP
jgi:hypothetical protein